VTSIPLYSSLLIANAAFTGEATFEVPSNITLVVRDIDAVVGIQVGTSVWAYDTAGVMFWGVNFGVTSLPFNTLSWRGRQVIPGPGFFNISTSASADIRASGYLLSAASP
jgi:hypothetical protein